ncbi:transcription-repair coupling factor [Paucilactobacillus suebicus]|uniref:Transcription-repair-coupling factor n=1 Tax=Paucilactobacillus suebicus DSM 5007 = KCTC 3549 TaxID=1423807 RepID=A0A0R1VVF7_9LACO|nr:transcription-repair coupling factor [Paucilactobacillus suebicus]KRM09745.1 transcription-repair coupling factor [Paucilactobacillus suebicus DSM 5007 = KCTC 3549]
MVELETLLEQMPAFEQINMAIKPDSRQLVTGIAGSARTLLISAIYRHQQHAQVIVCDNNFHMEQLASDLLNQLPEDSVFQFPAEEMLAAEVATSSPDFRLQRVQALQALLTDQHCVVVTSAAGIRRFLPAPNDYRQAVIHLAAGDDVDLEKIRMQLGSMGYQLGKMVERPGDFAIRGSIIDIYPLNTDHPVRVDLFDTEIDSLRLFDADNQRSLNNVDEVTILPATDFVIAPSVFDSAAEKLNGRLAAETKKLKDDKAKQHLNQTVSPLVKSLQHHQLLPEMMEFVDFIYPTKSSLLDYLNASSPVYFDDYSRIVEAEKQLIADEADWIADKRERHQLLATETFGFELDDLVRQDNHPQILFALFQKGMGQMRFTQINDLKTRNMQQFFGQMPILKAEMQRWQKQKMTVVMMANSRERVEKINDTLEDFGIEVTETKGNELKKGIVQIVAASLQNGFEWPAAQLVVVTEGEMFKQVKKKRIVHQSLANAERIKNYTDLKPGDYVVHVNHGIGIFQGIQTMEVSGVRQDYIVINYRDNAQIFVPVNQLNLVQKYVSSESKTPRINKLGGTEWAKTKRKVADKIEDIADDLIELYAQRKAEKGYPFPRDDSYQQQFEDDFPYNETRDQLRSSEEIKRDMETEKPMDRLLVGDVGFGKTEVALRAAFKAVEDGKQVAFLVPTTILAQQHFDTIETRFEGYPVTVGLMSRFKTTKELRQTENELKDGQCDIVVGTHRLLSKDVKFKDLGLLIIDEEQRFGVKHKERLKQMKQSVDVLTLTATPIPRTLNMSMLGVRDLSVIETPPAGRFPIQTYVMEQNAGALRDGIMREMQRGGQVYYLHNRVMDIEKTVAQVQSLVPEARVGYIHGRMTEAQLEGVLYDFIRGEYDVLVTTSIIETGVDIPNVNTLFVENADRMGLAQLYQIRGRIGRSDRVAYAYFMYQQDKVLNEVSEKRLAAIRDFTELGSGFKIAMRDLSIRGAGNLLGKQQHGFIDSVGYDLYSQMLSEAVAKKQGKKVAAKSDAEIELGLEAYLPDSYIDDQRQKIELYKQIRQVQDDDQLMEMQSDLIDRFGEYGDEVNNLLEIARLKMYADMSLIEKITRQNDYLIVTLTKIGSQKIKPQQMLKNLALTKFKATIGEEDGKMSMRLVIQPKMTQKDWLSQLTKLIEAFAEQTNEEQKNEAQPTQ